MARFGKWLEDVSEKDRTVDVAVCALRQRTRGIVHFFPKAAKRWQRDSEYVHELRVWTRRSAAVLEMFRDVFPPRRAAWLDKEFRNIRKAANDARDLDVLIARFQQRDDRTRNEFVGWLEEQRRLAQKPIRQEFKRQCATNRLKEHVDSILEKTLKRGRKKNWRKVRFGAWSKERLAKLTVEFLQRAEGEFADIEALHELRIAGKELRYAIELFAFAFPKSLRKTTYNQVAEMQQLLGTINDHAVSLHRFERWQDNAGLPLDDAVLESLIAYEEAALSQSQEAFFLWWTDEFLADLRRQFAEMLGDHFELARHGKFPIEKSGGTTAQRPVC